VKVSLEWISDFINLPHDLAPAQLAHDLTLKTVEVEEVEEVDGDVVLEIDNKSLTNRPDLWGHYGIARELAAIYRLPLRPLDSAPWPAQVERLIGSVDTSFCDRFTVVEFSLDDERPTPEVIRRRLERIGAAPISLCVDLSNYVMFTVGQPNHVWDEDAVRLPLSAATCDRPQRLAMVASPDMELPSATPVIRDDDGALGVAGIMGGSAASVQPSSRRFLLEVATFRARTIRRASQQLGLRTEASARFEKGLDTQRVDLAIGLFLALLRRAVPDVVVSGFQDVTLAPTSSTEIVAGRDFLDDRIGEHLDDDEITSTLTALGFAATVEPDAVRATTPTWRSTGDVALPHDLLEELARIHGYDRLRTARTSVTLRPVRSLNRESVDRRLREALAIRGGLQEVITYPWSADQTLAACGFSKERTVRFEGATSPDHDSLRPALLPNLLEAITSNLRHRPAFTIFELGTVFSGDPWTAYQGRYEVMPRQPKALGLAFVGDGDGALLFRRAVGTLDMLRRRCHLLDLTTAGPTDAAWSDPSARVGIQVDGQQVGTVALVRPRALRAAGIEGVHVAYAELDLTTVTVYSSRTNIFVPIPELPGSDFDLSLVLRDDVTWAMVASLVRKAHDLVSAVDYLEEYHAATLPPGHRSLTFRVTLQPIEKTLTREEILAIRSDLLHTLEEELGARLR